MTRIYDANNWVRAQLESVHRTSATRAVFEQFLNAVDAPVIVWDGPHALKARRAIYPGYKEKRTPAKRDIYVGFELVQQVLDHCPVVQIHVPEFEADDVIATIAKPGDYIHSTDRDFLQLEGVQCGARPLPGVFPQHVKTYKTLVGDPSDNIPGIPNFGEKSWMGMNHTELDNWLRAVVAGKDVPLPSFPSRCRVNLDDLKTYWKIISFLPVPLNLITDNMTVGQRDPAKGYALLEKYFQ